MATEVVILQFAYCFMNTVNLDILLFSHTLQLGIVLTGVLSKSTITFHCLNRSPC